MFTLFDIFHLFSSKSVNHVCVQCTLQVLVKTWLKWAKSVNFHGVAGVAISEECNLVYTLHVNLKNG